MASPTKNKLVLLLRLEGPWQSWGVRSRWDVRDTTNAPTKSGVLGLLGCALGLERGDPELLELNHALSFGVRVEHPGKVVTDYQTITDYLPTAGGAYKLSGSKTASSLESAQSSGPPATIISPRAYLEDAAFLVGLEERNGGEDILRRCAAALQNPRWPLFLGRKSCIPTRPIYDAQRDGLRREYSGLEDALSRHRWDWCGAQHLRKKLRMDNAPLRIYLEDESGDTTWQDAPLPGAARIYGFRRVRQMRVPLAPLLPSRDAGVSTPATEARS